MVSNFKSTFLNEINPALQGQRTPELTPTHKITDTFEEQINDIDGALNDFDISGGGNHAQNKLSGNIPFQNNPINTEKVPLTTQIPPQPKISSHTPLFPLNNFLEPTQPKISYHAPKSTTQPKTLSHAEPTQPKIPFHAPTSTIQSKTPSHAPTSTTQPKTPSHAPISYPKTYPDTPTPSKLHSNTRSPGTWKRIIKTDKEEV